MSALTTDATVKYGSYTFSPMALTVGLQGRPVYDAAGRTIIYVVYAITLRDWIQSDTKTSAQMEAIRTQLNSPAREFVYDGMGFANSFKINTTGLRDVIWGPKPQLLSCTHLGSGNAWKIEWTVEVAICECGNDCAFGRPMEFNYTLATAVDRRGLTRRVYSGFLRIPQTRARAENRNLADHADHYLEKIVPPEIPGFRRIPGSHALDESKCKLTFEITDEELPAIYAPPPKCIEAKFSHSLETGDVSMLSWRGMFNGSYELVKGTSGKDALQYFLASVKKVLDETKKNAEAQTVIPYKFSMRESDRYGPATMEFSLGYTYVTRASKILAASGMWQPVPNSDWQKWSQSLQSTAFNARGVAGLKFSINDDAIWDLCEAEGKIPTVPGAGLQAAPGVVGQLQTVFESPKADESWIGYENSIRIETLDEVAELKPLPVAAVPLITRAILSPLQLLNGDTVHYANQAVKTILQQRAAPTIYAIMQGVACRAGYDIIAPRLETINGVKATPRNQEGDGFWTKVMGNWGGIPIIGAQWRLRYLLNKVPLGKVVPPPNPLMETGTTTAQGRAAAVARNNAGIFP